MLAAEGEALTTTRCWTPVVSEPGVRPGGVQDGFAGARGGSMRYTTSLATAAFALALPFILAHCASLQPNRDPLTYDAKSVGKPNSGAALELWLPPGPGPFP